MSSLIGRVVDNYRIEARLGDGGMGTVFRAYDSNLDRHVAIKMIHPQYAHQPEFRTRLRQEAKAVASLDHPSIVRILDFGETREMAYIVMEYIPGGSLRDHLQRLQEQHRYLPLQHSLQIGYQIAEALDYSHRNGIIHRDVKPSNIIMKRLARPDEPEEAPFRAVLTDFGLVKLLEGGQITQSGTTLGTPAYMSPEQCFGNKVDGRSDLYSLGIVLYELLTNRLPFHFNSLADALATHMRGEMPAPPRLIRPEVPAVVDAIVIKALQKEPAERFISGDALASALRSALLSLSSRPTQVMVEEPLQRTPPPATAPEGYQLIIETPGHTPVEVPLSRPLVTIGRDADNDVVLPVDSVSRQHARLQAQRGTWLIVDLGSVNNTMLNGEWVQANTPTPLTPGDRLQIGPYTLQLQKIEEDVVREPYSPPTVPIPLAEQTTIPPDAEEPERPPLELFLARDKITVVPGERAEFPVEIVNRSEQDDRVILAAEGLPDTWFTVPSDFITVDAGDTQQTVIQVHPPRERETPSGRQRFLLRLRSREHPEAEITAAASLMLGAFDAFAASLEPEEVTLPAIVHVTLLNQGNAPSEFKMGGHSRGQEIIFQGEQGHIRLEPGQRATMDLALSAQERNWLSAPEPAPFEIEVSSRSGVSQTLAGQAIIPPLVPPWISGAVLVLLVFSCVFTLLFLLFGLDRDAGAAQLTQTAVAAVELETIVAARATIEAATRLAITPTSTGDRDNDGLSDQQELLLGTNVELADTDSDGLPDGLEVLTYGCNPLERDTDGDFLNDWEEVNLYQTECDDVDTDNDGIPDGVEVIQGTNPVVPATVTPTVTGTLGPTNTPSITPTPSNTPTATSTNAPTATSLPTGTAPPSATPTWTPLPTVTPSATSVPPTPTPTWTPIATTTPLPSPTLTLTPGPSPALALVCFEAPPAIDGELTEEGWQNATSLAFDSPTTAGRPVTVYLAKDAANLYFAFVVTDPQTDPSDALRLYLDTNNNRGDPDTADRLFLVERDADVALFEGIGSNFDGQNWQPRTSELWEVAVDDPSNVQWITEMAVPFEDVGAVADPLGMMLEVLYGDETVIWPTNAFAANAATWTRLDNPACP